MAASQKIPHKVWHQAQPAPLVLISGAEDFLADRATQRIREMLKEQDPAVEVHDIEASSYAPGTLLTLASPSLFGEPRLIRVSHVEKCNDDFLQEMLEYVESPDRDTTVVLRHGGGVRGKKLLDRLRSSDLPCIEVACPELKTDNDKFDFAAAEFSLAQRTIAPSALRSLVQAFSSSGSELANACQQLIADTPGEITDRIVEDYYGGRVESTAFKVVDAAVVGRLGDALMTLRNALNSGADPVPIVATFAAKLRLMSKLYGQRASSSELAGQLGAAPWQIDRARKDLSGWSDEGLGVALDVIAETDANVKGASRDPIYALEHMVHVVADYGRR